MNIGPISTSMPAAASNSGAPVGETQASGESTGGNINIPNNNALRDGEDPKIPGGAPEPLKQMATADFLSLRETTQTDNMMDKLAKIFETILALRLLEKTVENVNKSLEEDPFKGEE